MNEGRKQTLLDEMNACSRDVSHYESEKRKAESDGNMKYAKNCEREIERAHAQYQTAKTEYVDLFGPGGF
jgi:hypothetical protein